MGVVVGATVGVSTTASSGAGVGAGSPHADISGTVIAKKKVKNNVDLRMMAIIARAL